MDSINFFYDANLSAFFISLLSFFLVLYGVMKALKLIIGRF